MSGIRNVVKVMNFHALLRVDAAKKQAEKYYLMEEKILEMMDYIFNNRNILLDTQIIKPKANARPLHIYFGSDYGFCANYNGQVSTIIRNDKDSDKIIIGRKLPHDASHVHLWLTKEEMDKDPEVIMHAMEELLLAGKCSEITIIYNRYISFTEINLDRKQIFPITLEKMERKDHQDDFLCEQDVNTLLQDMLVLHLHYQVMLCAINTFAAENILRQNTTSESLKKIDEQEELHRQEEQKIRKHKQLGKIIENFLRQSSSEEEV